MLTRTIIAAAVSALGTTLAGTTLAGTTLSLSAQVPAPAPGPSTPARPTTSGVGAQTVANLTLVGCLYHEKSVPGRTPNVAEKAGVREDYILAGATMPADAAKNTTLATGNMYEVDDISEDKLRPLVGKRVEVTGRIDPDNNKLGAAPAGPTPDKGLGPDTINLPEFDASTIKEVAGTCPATPPARSK
jgi:hypothetical protein